jgi:hypothetical protein
MPDRPVRVYLEGSSTDVTEADGWLTDFSLTQRVLRAGGVMLLALVMASLLIPVPIVHLLGIPLVLVTGIAVAVRQATSVARLRPLKMACPKCGRPNRIGGGLGYRSVAEPMERTCDSCRRILTVRIEAAGAHAAS